MKKFSYLRPATIKEALEAHSGANGQAVYLAGGTDVMVKYRRREIAPDLVISLTRLEGLKEIRDEGDRIVVGGLATLRELELSPLIRRSFPILADALANMASVQIRNVATMAGNIVNAAPSADTAPPLLAVGAELILTGRGGTRQVALDGFHASPGRTAIEPGEILTGFVLPKPHGPAGGGYAKISRRRAMDLALVGIAVQIEFEDDLLTCRRARIGLGVAGPTPRRAGEAEDFLAGRPVNEDTLTRAGRLAAEESACRTTLRGEAWYRREMIRVHVRRMGLLAQSRAAGNDN